MTDRNRCSRCKQDLPLGAFSPSHRNTGNWCKACRKTYMASYNRTGTCQVCGLAASGLRCMDCYRKHRPARAERTTPKRRRLTDAEYLKQTLAKHPRNKAMQLLRSGSRWLAVRAQFIAQLESFDCGICGSAVDMDLPGTVRMGPTLDHITPVALGGAFYDHKNLRLAHRSCNAKGGRQHERSELLAIQGAARWLSERLAS